MASACQFLVRDGDQPTPESGHRHFVKFVMTVGVSFIRGKDMYIAVFALFVLAKLVKISEMKFY